MNKKFIALTTAVIVICALAGATAYYSLPTQASTPLTSTGELEITVNGSSNCLRFLNDSVPMVYVPFTVEAGKHMQLTINATKMPNGGYTELYYYNGYWDQRQNNTCKSSDVYPIISEIRSAEHTLTTASPFVSDFGGNTTTQSWTMFFVFPPGGPTQFHITLKPT